MSPFSKKGDAKKHEKRGKRHGGMQATKAIAGKEEKTMEEKAEKETNEQQENKEKAPRKKARYHRWTVAYKGNERHPRVMIAKKKTEKGKRIVNAKLHLTKDGETEDESKFIYFSPNPNPEITDRDGAFYRHIRYDDPNLFVTNDEFKKWKVSKDGRKKMKFRYKEQIKNQKALKKAIESKKKENKKAQRRRDSRTLGSFPLNHLRLRNLIKPSSKGLSRGKKRKKR